MTGDSGLLERDSRTHPDVPDPEVSAVGDSQWLTRSTTSGRLKVYESGKLTVVGFGGEDVPSEYCLVESRQFLIDLIQANTCEELVFDLTGVRLIPSGMLGVMASLRNLGVTIFVSNPSDDILEVLQTTQLDRIIRLRDLET